VILSYIFLKKTNTFANKLVLMLCIADFMALIGKISSSLGIDFYTNNHNACVSISIWLSFWDLCTIIWPCLIAYTLYASVNFKNKQFLIHKLYVIFYKYLGCFRKIRYQEEFQLIFYILLNICPNFILNVHKYYNFNHKNVYLLIIF
jgi:hypothetical protein